MTITLRSEDLSAFVKILSDCHTWNRARPTLPGVPTGASIQHIHGDHVAGRKLPHWVELLEVDYQGEGQAKSVAVV